MKYEGYITNSKNEWATITDEDIAKYPKRHEMETMYAKEGDITFIWAVTILCTPDGGIELNRQIINFIHGELDHKYAEHCFQEFITHGTIGINQELLFDITEDKMKYEGYITGSKNEWTTITSEDIVKYPKRYAMETMYARHGDTTFIWAVTILCMPNTEVEIHKQIINFMCGKIDNEYSRKYAEHCFQEFITHGTVDISRELLFELTEDE